MGEFGDWDDGFGPPEYQPVPRGRTALQRFAVVASIVAAALVLVGLGVWLVALASPEKPEPTPAAKGPSDSITESFVVTTTGAASQEVTPTGPGLPAVPVGPKKFTRAPKVAFRQDGALYVSAEDGKGPRKVVVSAGGAFALSPDAEKLAFVDGASKELAIADVDSGKVTTVGPAVVTPPTWSPSSAWLVFVDDGQVRRVESDGAKMRFLGKGTEVAIGPDDKTYAFSSGATVTVGVGDSPKVRTLKVKAKVTGLALGKDRLFYATAGATPQSLTLHSSKLDGSDDRQLIGGSSDAKAGQYGAMQLSPDGTYLGYAVLGDDAHSRLQIMRVDGTLDTKLSLRHDDYLLRWSADGKKVLFIDGNVLQGDSTQLMSARPDNTMRLTLVRGAGL